MRGDAEGDGIGVPTDEVGRTVGAAGVGLDPHAASSTVRRSAEHHFAAEAFIGITITAKTPQTILARSVPPSLSRLEGSAVACPSKVSLYSVAPFATKVRRS